MSTLHDTEDQSLSAAAEAFSKLDDMPPADAGQRDDDIADADPNVLDNGDQVTQPDDAEGDNPDAPEGEQEEPAPPAIEPPARWNSDQKQLWSGINADAQRVIAATMQDQERAIGAKAEESASHRRAAEEATTALQGLHQRYAAELEQFATMYMPQPPDPALARSDPQAYIAQKAEYDADIAQRTILAQRADAARQQQSQIAEQQRQQAIRADYGRLVEAIPDYADESKRSALHSRWTETAVAYGLPKELLGQADATDMIAFERASADREKAKKWDELQARTAANKRGLNPAPRVATPGAVQPRGSAQSAGLNDAKQRLAKSGSVADAAAVFRNLGRR